MIYYPVYRMYHIYLDLLAAVLDICYLENLAQRLFSASKTHRAWLSPSWRVWQECQCLKYFSSGPYCHWHHWHWTVVMLYLWTVWSPCLYTISYFIHTLHGMPIGNVISTAQFTDTFVFFGGGGHHFIVVLEQPKVAPSKQQLFQPKWMFPKILGFPPNHPFE